jgi:putative NIF3 family GTP cyclohydrolase 1 type 2
MSSENIIDRRAFLKATPLVLGGIGALAQADTTGQAPATAASSPVTVQDVIDRILSHANIEPIEDTVDTIKVGQPDRVVRGIVTTFMATTKVIHWAINNRAFSANLIITHEPTFYSHRDETDWLKNDIVYQHKRALLDKHGVTVWRYHDHLHKIKPDPIFEGLIGRLGWTAMADPDDGRVCHVPQTTLGELARHCKEHLNLKALRYVGAPDLPCKTVGLLPGAWGGKPQIGFLAEGNIDVLICGEVNEWETNEYVRDSQRTDRPLGLIITGHQRSEEDGMRTLAAWLNKQYPRIPVGHRFADDPFRLII